MGVFGGTLFLNARLKCQHHNNIDNVLPNNCPSRPVQRDARGASWHASLLLPFTPRWAGNNKFFDGQITAYSSRTDTYAVLYDDGDRDDALQFKNYEVIFVGLEVECVRVLETDKDEMELAANTITQLAAAGRYSSGQGSMRVLTSHSLILCEYACL